MKLFIKVLSVTMLISGLMSSANASEINNLNKRPNKENSESPTRVYIDSIDVEQRAKTVSVEFKRKTRVIANKDSVQVVTLKKEKDIKIISKYAQMLGIPDASINNTSLYSFIDSWYGTRYVYGGTGKRGIDCSAFVRELYSAVYKMDLMRTSILQFGSCKQISDKSKLTEGDLVFFNTLGRGVSHVGVYLQNNKFVHSSSSNGVGISDLSGYWSSKFITGGRIL